MRRGYAFFFLLTFAAALGAAPPEGPARPIAPVIELPPGPPAPKPVPVARLKLAAGRVYDIRCKAPCVLRAYPAHLVSVVREVVPAGETLVVAGDFTDGAKTHRYKGPLTVYSVRATGTGTVELVVTPLGLKAETEIVTVALDVDDGTKPIPPPEPDPVPPPKPKPKPEPKPEPEPDPVVRAEKVWVVVVEDAAAPRSFATAKALNDPFWLLLKPKHDFRHYLSDSKPAIDNGYVEAAKKVGYPAALVLDAKDGEVLKSLKFTSAAEIDAAVKAVTK